MTNMSSIWSIKARRDIGTTLTPTIILMWQDHRENASNLLQGSPKIFVGPFPHFWSIQVPPSGAATAEEKGGPFGLGMNQRQSQMAGKFLMKYGKTIGKYGTILKQHLNMKVSCWGIIELMKIFQHNMFELHCEWWWIFRRNTGKVL